MGVGTKQFAVKAMTCSLPKCLKALDMYTGQSVHSTRRGNMIHRQHVCKRVTKKLERLQCAMRKMQSTTLMCIGLPDSGHCRQAR